MGFFPLWGEATWRRGRGGNTPYTPPLPLPFGVRQLGGLGKESHNL